MINNHPPFLYIADKKMTRCVFYIVLTDTVIQIYKMRCKFEW